MHTLLTSKKFGSYLYTIYKKIKSITYTNVLFMQGKSKISSGSLSVFSCYDVTMMISLPEVAKA